MLFSQYPWLFPLFIGIFALLIGSFLNVVIHRLPIMMSRQYREECQDYFPELIDKKAPPIIPEKFNLNMPRSHCPSCQTQISMLENIPVLSWLFQKGKCKHCKTPISKRYPLVELLTAALSVIVALQIPNPIWAIALVGFTFVLVALAFIDIDTLLLPDQLTLPLMWAGIAAAVFGISPISVTDAVVGAMAGYLCLWSVFWTFKLITGKDGMGYGDFKLLAALGAWLGWSLLPLVVLLSSVLGAISGLLLLKRQQQDHQTPFSFGPYLALAGWLAALWGQDWMAWYLINFLGA